MKASALRAPPITGVRADCDSQWRRVQAPSATSDSPGSTAGHVIRSFKKTMHLKQAIKKSKRQIIIGWTLSIIALIMLIMSCVLTLYYMTLGSNVFDKPFNQIALAIFQNTQFFGLKYLWKNVPVVYYPEIFTVKNLGFAAIVCLFVFGVVVRDSGISSRSA